FQAAAGAVDKDPRVQAVVQKVFRNLKTEVAEKQVRGVMDQVQKKQLTDWEAVDQFRAALEPSLPILLRWAGEPTAPDGLRGKALYFAYRASAGKGVKGYRDLGFLAAQ